MRRSRSTLHLVLGLTATLVLTTHSHAVDSITSCDATCESANCELADTLTCCEDTGLCDGAGPITVKAGKNLDLNGESLECFCGTLTCNGGSENNELCTADSDCPGGTCENQTGCTTCGTAIIIEANGSIIKNDGAGESAIFGPWTTGIDCDGYSSTRVREIRFESLDGGGVVDCAQVDQNVLIGGGGTGIATVGIANSDYIRNNHVEDFVTGIKVTGAKGVSVDHNLVSVRRSDGTGIAGIDVSGATSTGLDVTDNVIMGEDVVPIDGVSSGNFDANSCNPLSAECGTCVDDTWCAAPTPPFTLP